MLAEESGHHTGGCANFHVRREKDQLELHIGNKILRATRRGCYNTLTSSFAKGFPVK